MLNKDFIIYFSVFFESDEFYCDPAELNDKENGGVAVLRGHRVVKLDIPARKAVLDNGLTVTYDKCLIATGLLQFFIARFELCPQ